VQISQAALAPVLARDQILFTMWIGVLALTAGLFEETGRYLGYRFWFKDRKTWRVGLMYGAGHGGLESMLLTAGLVLLGLINILALSSMDLSQLNLTLEQLAQIEQARRQIQALH